MDQLQIKYRNEIYDKLDPVDIYNDTLILNKMKMLHNNFNNFVLTLSIYVVIQQLNKQIKEVPKNSVESYDIVKLIFYIILILIIVGVYIGLIEGNILKKPPYNCINVNDTEKFPYFKYDKDNIIINDEFDIIKLLSLTLTLFITLLSILTIFTISYKLYLFNSGNTFNINKWGNLILIIIYIFLFTILFYELFYYLFDNFNQKQENNLSKKLSLLQILAKQVYNDQKKQEGLNSDKLYFDGYTFLKKKDNINFIENSIYDNDTIEKFNFIENDITQLNSYQNLILNIFKYPITDMENIKNENIKNEIYKKLESLKDLKEQIDKCLTEQEKKSIINTEKDIIEPLNSSKNLLNKDNNKYELEIIYFPELINFFHLLFQNCDKYQMEYYKGQSLISIQDFNYELYDNEDLTDKNVFSITCSNDNILETVKNIGYIYINGIETKLSLLDNSIITESSNTYKIFNIYNNLIIFKNKIKNIINGISIQDSTTINNNITKGSNEYLYNFIEKIINIINSITLKNTEKNNILLKYYINIDGLNYDVISNIIINSFNKIKGDLNETTPKNYKKEDISDKLYNLLNDELNFILPKINTLQLIYEKYKNDIHNNINIHVAKNYYIENLKSLETKLISLNDDDIKKKYFISVLKKEIDLFNISIKTNSISEDDFKLIKDNQYSDFKFSLYIYKYLIEEFSNIFFISQKSPPSIEDLKFISNEKIYKIFLNELNKNNKQNINKEKLLKNYHKIFKFLISNKQLEDIKQCISAITLDTTLNDTNKYITKDIYNKLLIEKDKKFYYNELCKYEKLEEYFITKYEPLIKYEIQNKLIDKNLLINIINIFLWIIIIIVLLYLLQSYIYILYDKDIINSIEKIYYYYN